MLKWKFGKIGVTEVATEIVPARSGRKTLWLWGFVTGLSAVFVKHDNTVVITDLNPVSPTNLVMNGRFELNTEEAVWGIRQSAGSSSISYIEIYEE